MSCFPVHNLITVWQLGLVQRSNSWWANGYSSDYSAACGCWALPWLPHQQQLDICSPSLLLPVSAWVKLAENGRKRAMSSIILSFFPTCAKELWTVWGSHGSTILWSSMVFYGLLWSSMVFYGLLWSSMVFYGLLWLRLWSTMVYYGPLWSTGMSEEFCCFVRLLAAHLPRES